MDQAKILIDSLKQPGVNQYVPEPAIAAKLRELTDLQYKDSSMYSRMNKNVLDLYLRYQDATNKVVSMGDLPRQLDDYKGKFEQTQRDLDQARRDIDLLRRASTAGGFYDLLRFRLGVVDLTGVVGLFTMRTLPAATKRFSSKHHRGGNAYTAGSRCIDEILVVQIHTNMRDRLTGHRTKENQVAFRKIIFTMKRLHIFCKELLRRVRGTWMLYTSFSRR